MLRQPQLSLVVPASTALVTVETARALLGCDEDSVLGLIDEGKIAWAWDIALTRDKTRRIRELRIWAQSLVARQELGEQPGGPIESVIREVVGMRTRERMRASEVRALLCCSQQHIQRLAQCGELRGEVERGIRRWITRESLEQFLKRRALR